MVLKQFTALCCSVRKQQTNMGWFMYGFDCRYLCRLFLFTGVVLQINNAGCMVNNRELTEDGLEKNFATNTLGEY